MVHFVFVTLIFVVVIV